MNGRADALAEFLEEARDLSIGHLLEQMGAALERGAKVRHEPLIRGKDGMVVREGLLHLPCRADLAITEGERTEIVRLPPAPVPDFKPCSMPRPDDFPVLIRPFSWNRAHLFLESGVDPVDWSLVRRWFLEAFQSRYGELAPDLDGAVHAIVGPERVEGGWELTVDFGSAPLSAFVELVDTCVISGMRRLTVSSESRIDQSSSGEPPPRTL